MLIPLLAASIALLHQEESPRLRTALPNGALILVENMPQAKTLSVQLFASSRRAPETSTTHGWRHLLEHLVAPGGGRNIDMRLESNGCFLFARTLRDAMQFEVSGGAGQLDLALDAIAAVLEPVKTSQSDIDREAKVLEQELGLVSDPQRLSRAAWAAAYGEQGLDPLGSMDAIAHATPESIADLQSRQFAPDGIVLVISGPVNIDQATAKAKRKLAQLKPFAGHAMATRRGVGKPGRGEAEEGAGEARAALVGSYRDVETVSALAAALAIAAQFDQPFVTYTPSIQNGLVIVGRTDENSGIGLKIDSLVPGQQSELFTIGKLLAREWVQRQLVTPSGSAYLRGLLLVQGEANKPELMIEAIERMGLQDFLNAMAKLSKDRAVIAVGVKN